MTRLQHLVFIAGAASLLLHAHDDHVDIQKMDGSARISRSAADAELQTARAVTGPWSTALDQSNPVDGSTRIAETKFFRAASISVMPEGFTMERVAGGLTYATSVAWDDQGNTYVVEAGGSFVDEPAAARILRVSGGEATEFINLTDKVAPPVTGILWHEGAFYITHRDVQDRSGAVSRVTPDGTVTTLISGIIDAQAEHFLDDIRRGPDGRIYICSGPAGNSAVVGIDMAPFVSRSPALRTTFAQDIVLLGKNYKTPDFRTDDPSDLVETGAFVPFGTATQPGQVIKGTNKAGGAVLVFELSDPEGTLKPHIFGLRNVIGIAWDQQGEMYCSVNGYDIRGSRPVYDLADATYRVKEGAWYGWPDFSAGLEPLTDPKFEAPASHGAPIFINGVQQPKKLGFVIDHAASGLTAPDKSLVLGLHELNSSPSQIDVAPESWGEFAGHVFVAEWGDLTPPTNPLQDAKPGYRISRINPADGRVHTFLRNPKPGPASVQGAPGEGLERPYGLRFGPDGALYVVDYGVARINPALGAKNKPPYEFPPETGVLWRIAKTAE